MQAAEGQGTFACLDWYSGFLFSWEVPKSKGHLAKEGDYIICRYVLADEQSNFSMGDWKISLINEDSPDDTKEVILNASSAKAAREQIMSRNPGYILALQEQAPENLR